MMGDFYKYLPNKKKIFPRYIDNYWFSLDASPYPKIFSVSLFYLLLLLLGFMNRTYETRYLFYLFLAISLILFRNFYGWFSNLILEGVFLGKHTFNLVLNLRMGMLLFILSEVLFFFGFFWAFFWYSVEPSFFLGGFWIPEGFCDLAPFGIPLANTVILVFSGICVTWSHISLHFCRFFEVRAGLSLTIILAFLFLLNQIIEYFSIALEFGDGVFGSIFFLSTGFHFLHVLVGTLFLFIIFRRFRSFSQLKPFHNTGFVFSIWYWHFVDLVWIFLYCFVYFWGGF